MNISTHKTQTTLSQNLEGTHTSETVNTCTHRSGIAGSTNTKSTIFIEEIVYIAQYRSIKKHTKKQKKKKKKKRRIFRIRITHLFVVCSSLCDAVCVFTVRVFTYKAYLMVLCRYNVHLLTCYLVCDFSCLSLVMIHHGCHMLVSWCVIKFRNFNFVRVLS